MASIPAQIVSAFTGAVAAAIPGGLWLDLAPQGTVMPFAVYSIVASPSDVFYGNGRRGDWDIDFRVYGNDSDAVFTAGTTLANTYATSSVGDNRRQLTEVRPENTQERDENGKDVFAARVGFQFNQHT